MASNAHAEAVLALANTVFGPEPADTAKAAVPALGKLWGRTRTAAGQVLEVRVGWLDGRQYLQFLEQPADPAGRCASILVPLDALGSVSGHLTSLASYEGS